MSPDDAGMEALIASSLTLQATARALIARNEAQRAVLLRLYNVCERVDVIQRRSADDYQDAMRAARYALSNTGGEAGDLTDEIEQLRQRRGAPVFAGYFHELPSAVSHRLWEQANHEQAPGAVALYELGAQS